MSRPEADAPFREPWEAQAFALVVALRDRGVLTAAEWAEALGAEVRKQGAAADGRDYYRHWLAALEKLLAAKDLTSTSSIDDLAAAWRRAAQATPHGEPVMLESDPLRALGRP